MRSGLAMELGQKNNDATDAGMFELTPSCERQGEALTGDRVIPFHLTHHNPTSPVPPTTHPPPAFGARTVTRTATTAVPNLVMGSSGGRHHLATSATTSHHTTALTERMPSPHRVDGSKAVEVWETSSSTAQRVTPSAAVSDSSGPESAPRGAEGGESEHWGTARRELQHDDVKIFGENMQEVVGVPAELPAADESTPADAPKYVSMPN
jgi:hypothetical protein